MSAARRPRLLCVYPLLDPALHPALEALGEFVVCPTGSDAEIMERIGDADAVLLRGPARLTAEHIGAAPRLRVIAAFGAGVDNVDVAAATRAGVPVTHGAGVASSAVAEFVLGAMVTAHRRMITLHRELVGGELVWADRLRQTQGRELGGTVLGVVGFGNIGRAVARRARAAFDVEVVAYDPFLTGGEGDGGEVEVVSALDELLDRSDTVTLHLPKTPDTIGLLGEAALERIGPRGVLIDAARGGIVDEAALVAVLRDGRLKAAVLDVLSEEPPPEALVARLAQAPNLVMTPHVAGVTDLAAHRLSAAAVEAVRAVLAGEPLVRVANPEALERVRSG